MTRKEFEKETAISVKSIGLNSRGKDYIIKINKTQWKAFKMLTKYHEAIYGGGVDVRYSQLLANCEYAEKEKTVLCVQFIEKFTCMKSVTFTITRKGEITMSGGL
ncbi:MAG: hypothetical protein HWN80_20735 [Candidatus Lokiarchaeota archaeon]|nr:hypothetical protein [Candidatus Lokiarchaeota archaeon]